MKRTLFLLFFVAITLLSNAQTWIWYPGDYEIWLGNQMNNRRTERGAFFPHFWKMDNHYVLVEFSKKIDLATAEKIEIAVEGTFNVKLDGKLQFGMPNKFTLPAGKHSLNIKVWNQSTPPIIFINGNTVKSDNSWKVTYEDKEWIDESGKASDTSATIYMEAEGWPEFNTSDKLPSKYKLAVSPQAAIKHEKTANGELIDFGKETFGYLQIKGLSGNGKVNIYYGESREEALDVNFGETLDRLNVDGKNVTDEALARTKTISEIYTLENSKAYRYVFITKDAGVNYSDVSMLYEYKPVNFRGKFRCNDEELNNIWKVGEYTMHLTTREFFIDGIKRDRWTWSGDAIQSYQMNYYLFFDAQTVRNTIWLLRGKDPVTSHSNTIMDYSFFWFLSIYDYYMYTGDSRFIAQIYPRMQTMMDYILGRTNKNGMVEGQTGDWVFVDWADGYMDKKGELSYEQVLFTKSLETMAICAELAGNAADHTKFERLAADLRAKLVPAFWNEAKKALVHNRLNGEQQAQVTRYANMFTSFYNYLSENQKAAIKTSVLLNDSILKISTPYMRYYELEALCAMGEYKEVMKEMKAYWGGMIQEGATSFWEKYNPTDKGAQHLSMYGRPYGKSLCHAWGASPIYLLGKYYLGIQPVKAGYSEFCITPNLGGLKWMEGVVPTPNGEIFLNCTTNQIVVKSDTGTGFLKFKSAMMPICKNTNIISKGNNMYEVQIEKGIKYLIKYKCVE
jgi:alpha-L-rhamnosidase